MDELDELAYDCKCAVNTARYDLAQSRWDEVIALGRINQPDDLIYRELVNCVQLLQRADRIAQADAFLRDLLDLTARKVCLGVLDRFDELVFRYRKERKFDLAEELVKYRLKS